MSISTKLREYLDQTHVPFEHHVHPAAYTAQRTAESLHVPGREMAKSVVINADGILLLAVVPSNHRVNLDHLKFITRSENMRLASESEFTDAFPSCEPGALPPFGILFGIATYCDTSLSQNDTIEFNAGSHADSIRMSFSDFKRLARPTMIDLVDHPRRHVA
jgi:Ala-tRNA(Pro) deacylase